MHARTCTSVGISGALRLIFALLFAVSTLLLGCDNADDRTSKSVSTQQSDEDDSAPSGEVIRDGPVAVTLPSGMPRPERTTETVRTAVGPVESIVYFSEGDDASVEVRYAKYPHRIIAPGAAERMLHGARDSIVRDPMFRLVEQGEIRDVGHKMMPYTFATSTGPTSDIYTRVQAHADPPYFVFLQYLSDDRDALKTAQADQFFESLEFDTSGVSE